jgi:hypothetical protein
MKKSVLLLFVCAFMVGCASAEVITKTKTIQKLDNTETVFLNLPKDATFETTNYKRSGNIYDNALAKYLNMQSVNVIVADAVEKDVEKSKIEAQNAGARYLFFSTLLHWEDRATNWTLRLDRIIVNVKVFDIATNQLVYSGNLEANNMWFAFINYPVYRLLNNVLPKLMIELYE